MSHPILNWKRCKRCKKPFDIGINFDECPDCRNRWVSKPIKKEREGEDERD